MQIATDAEVGYAMIKMLLNKKLTCEEVALICSIPDGITKVEDKLLDIVFKCHRRLLIIGFNGHFYQLKYTVDTSYENDANVYRSQIAVEMFEHERVKVTRFYTKEKNYDLLR